MDSHPEPTDALAVDVSFGLGGGPVQADHAFSLFSSISRIVPQLHDDPAIGIHQIGGVLTGGRMLSMNRASRLRVRLPAERIGLVIPLAGKRLDVGGCPVRVGVPSVEMLRPSAVVQSRLVIVSGFTEADGFLEAVKRQLEQLGVAGEPALVGIRAAKSVEGRASRGQQEFVRRTLAIHGRHIVGFALRVSGLEGQDSIRLQSLGLGGRRHFGCGIFLPVAAT